MRAIVRVICIVLLCAPALASAPTAAQEQVGTTSQPLITETNVELWTTRNNTIPVCWESAGFDREKQLAKAAIEGSWVFWAAINVIGWGMCPTSGSDYLVRISVSLQDTTQGPASGSAAMGTEALTRPGEPAGMYLHYVPGETPQAMVEYVAVHEFGHLLGFGHEQDAPANEGPGRCDKGINPTVTPIPLTEYDRDSIMNYCLRGDYTGNLTDTDIRGAQQIYGVRRAAVPPVNSCQSSQVTGTASLAGVWNDYGATTLGIYPSDRTQFLYHTNRSIREGGWGDSVKWVSGDFDGNGHTDIGAAWNNSGHTTLTMRMAQPDGTFAHVHWLEEAGGWIDSTVYLPGDFNGDGLSDIAAVWNDFGLTTVSVYVSDGAKFPGWTHWSKQEGGWGDTVKWTSGDFNHDGLSDIAAIWNNQGLTTVTVRESTGNGFIHEHRLNSAGPWHETSLYVAGDFTGDGWVDIAQIWNDLGMNSISVIQAVGGGFLAPEPWAVRDGGIPIGLKWVAGDFDGNGRTDLVAIWDDEGTNTLTVRLSNGGSFGAAHWSHGNGGWIASTAWCAGRWAT